MVFTGDHSKKIRDTEKTRVRNFTGGQNPQKPKKKTSAKKNLSMTKLMKTYVPKDIKQKVDNGGHSSAKAKMAQKGKKKDKMSKSMRYIDKKEVFISLDQMYKTMRKKIESMAIENSGKELSSTSVELKSS